MIAVEHAVPYSMQVFCRIVVRKLELISAFVTLREGLVDSVCTMQRLMNVPKIVDQQSESIGLGSCFCNIRASFSREGCVVIIQRLREVMPHHCFVDSRILVPLFIP